MLIRTRAWVVISHVALFAAGLPGVASAQASSGDSEAGRDLAVRRCSLCHSVADQRSRVARHVPSFSEIAQMRSTTDINLRAFIKSQHVPELILRRRSLDDLVAYILSLRRS